MRNVWKRVASGYWGYVRGRQGSALRFVGLYVPYVPCRAWMRVGRRERATLRVQRRCTRLDEGITVLSKKTVARMKWDKKRRLWLWRSDGSVVVVIHGPDGRKIVREKTRLDER